MFSVRLLDGLPAYGDLAVAFPDSFGKTGREGTVVEFKTEDRSWVGNFQPGLSGLEFAERHPNERDAVVIAGGDLWVVDVETVAAEYLLPSVYSVIPVTDPDGWILSRQDCALARLAPDGIAWHTKRISCDGFDQVRILGDKVTGLAWNPFGDSWEPFDVDLQSGNSSGYVFSVNDTEEWEHLACSTG